MIINFTIWDFKSTVCQRGLAMFNKIAMLAKTMGNHQPGVSLLINCSPVKKGPSIQEKCNVIVTC